MKKIVLGIIFGVGLLGQLHGKGIDFTKGKYYNGHNFSAKANKAVNLSLVDADFSGCHLNGANFTGADMKGANLSNTYVNGTDFTGADLSGANFDNLGVDDGLPIFEKANLTGVNFTSTIIFNTNSPVNLKGAKLINATLSDTWNNMNGDFYEADLSGANLYSAYFYSSSNLEKTNLNGANLKYVGWNKVSLEGACVYGAKNFVPKGSVGTPITTKEECIKAGFKITYD